MEDKSGALRLISESIRALGYNDKQLAQNYSLHLKGNTVLKLDIVAFGDENVHDTATSCISVKWATSNSERQFYKEKVKYLATPVMLLADGKNVDVVKVRKTQGENIITLQYSELHRYFQDNRFDLSSSNIIEAKYGFKQLSVFEAFDLFEYAEKVNADILGEEFVKGLFAGRKVLYKMGIKDGESYKTLTSITMHVLAAIIISHKLHPEERVTDIHALMDKFSKNYINYFDKEYIYSLGRETVDNIFNTLDKYITYNCVNNEMLGHFYESTLIGEDELKKESVRKELGIYYTPKTLADDMLNHIPIEYVNISQRHIFDGTCGSGHLLISAYKRLEKLLPFTLDPGQKHNYLTGMLNGIDKDRFAREVARLALLLYSLPFGNHWKVECADLLKVNKLENMEYPMIIVANPLFRQEKKGEQLAVDFLLKYIEFLKPGGYIGIILPETFLENHSGKKLVNVRRQFLQNFDILEIWSLPGTIFQNNCATCVIVAKKTEVCNDEPRPIKIKIVVRNKNSIEEYLRNKKVDFQFFVKGKQQWLNNKNCIIDYSPIETVLNKMEKFRKLDDVVDGIYGMDIPLQYPYIFKQFKNDSSKYIHNAEECFKPFFVDWEKQKGFKYIKYDIDANEYEILKRRFKSLRLRYESRNIYERTKVLVKRSSTPGTFWCINAAIDREVCYPGSAYYCIIPRDEKLCLEELAAVLNSKAVNAYVRSRSRKMKPG